MDLNMPVIKSSRYILRDIRESDFMDLYEYGKDFETTKYVSWGPFTNSMQALYNIENIFLKRPMEKRVPIGYAIVDPKTSKMIGQIDYHTINHQTKTGEIGFILNKEYWNQGIMTSVVKIMIKLGFDFLGLDKIIIGHVRENIASEHVIKKCDFKYEYTSYGAFKDKENGYYHDALYYSIFKNEYERGNLKWQ